MNLRGTSSIPISFFTLCCLNSWPLQTHSYFISRGNHRESQLRFPCGHAQPPFATVMRCEKSTMSTENDNTLKSVEGTRCLFQELVDLDEASLSLPTEFDYPFQYDPHPVARLAAEELKDELKGITKVTPLDIGKMFGVLVVRNRKGKLGYLKAYSGTVKSTTSEDWAAYCPMIYDRGEGFYPQGEAELNRLTADIRALECDASRQQRGKVLRQSIDTADEAWTLAKQEQKLRKKKRKAARQEQKEVLSTSEFEALEEQMRQESASDQRKVKALRAKVGSLKEDIKAWGREVEDIKDRRTTLSTSLTNQLFENYQFWNIRGEKASLLDIFKETPLGHPPGGAGDCAAPKLFQAAFQRGDSPIALAEFWWGPPPSSEVRKEGLYYPACRGKCEPILGHMLKGMDVAASPILDTTSKASKTAELKVLFEDDYMVVVNKPHEMLSVPGRSVDHSVYNEMKERYPDSTGPLLVHRLDLSTSGILVVAKDKDTHKDLSAQFAERKIVKRYEALLEGECLTQKGKIELPLNSDYVNRPMQKVDFEKGKAATTYYEVLKVESGRTRIYFYPVTGRTHQLRVHAAHAKGLGLPIVGDDIYGERDSRLCLHAGYLECTHPVAKKRLTFNCPAPF